VKPNVDDLLFEMMVVSFLVKCSGISGLFKDNFDVSLVFIFVCIFSMKFFYN
jgi:hypothetical protein